MSTTTTNYSLIKPAVNDPVDEDLWGGYLNTDLDSIDTLIKALNDALTIANPIGRIVAYGGTSAPSRWLLCYGQAISRTTYSSLFAILSTTYGSGDGSTTFNLPDLRGRVIAGQDDMGGTSANRLTGLSGGVNGDNLGAAGGAETHTLTEGQLASHDHYSFRNGGSSGNPLTNANYPSFDYTSGGTIDDYVIQGHASVANIGLTDSAGADQAHNNVQPTIILNYIIYAGA
jgi:microcystin-dependent protein